MKAISLAILKERRPLRQLPDRLRPFWRWKTAHKSLSILFTGSVLLLGACEATDTANAGGSQEAKRRAAIERRRQQAPVDEADTNLWRAQQNVLNRDSNPTRAY